MIPRYAATAIDAAADAAIDDDGDAAAMITDSYRHRCRHAYASATPRRRYRRRATRDCRFDMPPPYATYAATFRAATSYVTAADAAIASADVYFDATCYINMEFAFSDVAAGHMLPMLSAIEIRDASRRRMAANITLPPLRDAAADTATLRCRGRRHIHVYAAHAMMARVSCCAPCQLCYQR